MCVCVCVLVHRGIYHHFTAPYWSVLVCMLVFICLFNGKIFTCWNGIRYGRAKIPKYFVCMRVCFTKPTNATSTTMQGQPTRKTHEHITHSKKSPSPWSSSLRNVISHEMPDVCVLCISMCGCFKILSSFHYLLKNLSSQMRPQTDIYVFWKRFICVRVCVCTVPFSILHSKCAAAYVCGVSVRL